MMKAIDAETFFEGDSSRSIPSDSEKPDFVRLVSHLKKLDPSAVFHPEYSWTADKHYMLLASYLPFLIF